MSVNHSERRMSESDRMIIDLMLKKNVVGICPKDKKICKLVRLIFKALGLVWTECRLLEEEVRFITEDDVGVEYYNKRRR